ncbi:MAG: hypothetical protein WHS44_09790 [Fimbriimonadales bacterium]|nr:MAG: hypothetical protein KatS3mg018_0183 [Fimbriimonadales bacterium]
MLARQNRVEKLLAALQRGESAEIVAEALEELIDKQVKPHEARAALLAAKESYPADEETDLQKLLLQIAAAQPDPAFAPIIENDFERYSPEAKAAALRLLIAIDTSEAIQLFTRFMQRDAPELDEIPLYALEEAPRHAPILFPDLLALLSDEDAAQHHFQITRLCWHYCQAGALTPQQIASAAPHILACYDRLDAELAPQQNPADMRWIWDDEDYLASRNDMAVLLDLMGYFDALETRARLQRAAAYADTRLCLYAALSLIRLGEAAPAQALARAAQSPETRRWLFERLQAMGRLDLYPQAHATQEALAESVMVDWLLFPTELGCPPDEIQLAGVYDIQTDEGVAEAYLFRFRMEDEDWEVGLAGPFLKAEQPTTSGLGATFSRFEKWRDFLLDKHVERILDLTGESGWRVVGKRQIIPDGAP